MVQNGVDVMEDVPLRDGAVAVASAKLFQRPVGDVLTAVGAVFGVGVEREALRTALGKLVCDYVRCEREKRPRSEEHTSELQSLAYLVCRLLLEKKNETT